MKSLVKICTPLLATVLLASCGGGGGDGHGAFTPAGGGRIVLSATTQDLPLNTVGAVPQVGSPFTAEVTVSIRKGDGTLVTEIDSINASITPVAVATISTLDDPETADINETQQRFGHTPVDVEAGTATIFVTSNASSGTAVLTITADPVNGLSFQSETMEFTVGNVAADLPAAISLAADSTSVYLPGSGGDSTTLITALVTDAGNQPVPDPADGNSAHNNVRFEIVGGAPNGSLSGTSASGNGVNGQVIDVRTTNGIANALFTAGSTQGPVSIRATADAADNNVDNGIASPVVSTITVVVSDGRVFNLTLTSPSINAIQINGVTEGIDAPTTDVGGVEIPVDPDGTYSLTVTALATDRQGNPVTPGTVIRFGAIDAPLYGYPNQGAGIFWLRGNDGNPEEGGTLFTAPTGQFTTAGGGAGPGDTLLVFGKQVSGNSDLESARTVAVVYSMTSLEVTRAFNLNDTTGASVDYGAVLPYIIGRADRAVIGASAPTDENGAASVQLTYPIGSLGRRVIIFAQADGATAADPVKIVTAIADIRFPGVAPAFITASPSPIRGNGTVFETVCVYDALGAPLPALPISFAFHDLGVGSGSVDDIPGAGVLLDLTNSAGCAVGKVETAGIAGSSGGAGAGEAAVTFSAAGASIDVPIVAGGNLLLLASPSAFQGSGGVVTLTLIDGSGNPVPGVQIGGTCSASGDGASVGLSDPPGVTDANGQTTATISASGLNGYGESSSGSCTFNTAGGAPTVTVSLTGQDLCTVFSPVPAQCNEAEDTGTLFIDIIRGSGSTNSAAVSVATSPAGISCSLGASDNGVSCAPGMFPIDSSVTITATVNSGGPITPSWSGDCTATAPNALSATVEINDSGGFAKSCTLSVND